MDVVYKEEFYKIKQACIEVRKVLGNGFLEKVYENALVLLLRELGLKVEQQRPITVYFHEKIVGEYIADVLVNDLVLLELKSAKNIVDQHIAQLLNYLKSTQIEVGLLLNFGPKAEFKRKVYDNERKGTLSWTTK